MQDSLRVLLAQRGRLQLLQVRRSAPVAMQAPTLHLKANLNALQYLLEAISLLTVRALIPVALLAM